MSDAEVRPPSPLRPSTAGKLKGKAKEDPAETSRGATSENLPWWDGARSRRWGTPRSRNRRPATEMGRLQGRKVPAHANGRDHLAPGYYFYQWVGASGRVWQALTNPPSLAFHCREPTASPPVLRTAGYRQDHYHSCDSQETLWTALEIDGAGAQRFGRSRYRRGAGANQELCIDTYNV